MLRVAVNNCETKPSTNERNQMAKTAYELERDERIAQNKQRLNELNIPQMFTDLQASLQSSRRRNNPLKRRQLVSMSSRPMVMVEKRRSGRLTNTPATDYDERALDKADSVRSYRAISTSSEEVYTEEHVKLLGDRSSEWELFVDGYDASGNRIYDKANGQTCHQCRQKTLGLRTSCSCCQSLKGVFCGDCLYMRYGENVKEVAKNAAWTCPDCRGICNCSIHRIRKGWAPTGQAYPQAIAAGYKSVAHMLILQNLAHPVEAAVTQAAPSQPASELPPPTVAPGMEAPAVQQQICDLLPRKRKAESAKATSSKKAKKAAPRPPLQPIGLQRLTRSRAVQR